MVSQWVINQPINHLVSPVEASKIQIMSLVLTEGKKKEKETEDSNNRLFSPLTAWKTEKKRLHQRKASKQRWGRSMPIMILVDILGIWV